MSWPGTYTPIGYNGVRFATLLRVPVTVTALATAPVKGMRLAAAQRLELGPAGAAGDRAFLVVDDEDRLLLTTRTPALLQVVPRWDGGTLTLTFPDGREVAAVPEPRRPATTANYEGRPIAGRLIEGDLAAALSDHLGRPVRLLARDPGERGADDAPVTLMSEASLAALAPALDGDVPDARRFRMTIAIDGVEAWEEHGWAGRRARRRRRRPARHRAGAPLRRHDARPGQRPPRRADTQAPGRPTRQGRRHLRRLVRGRLARADPGGRRRRRHRLATTDDRPCAPRRGGGG